MLTSTIDAALALHPASSFVAQISDPVLERLFDNDLIIPLLAITCGTIIAIVAITFTALRTIFVSRAREQSRRELAAYVAEGTLDPDKAVALLEAGKPVWEKGPSKPAC
jgi:hypothetical protein